MARSDQGAYYMKNDIELSSSEYEFFQEFYEKNKRLIYYLVVQCGAGNDEVDDVVQDVVLRLMNYIPTLTKISSSQNRVANYIAQTVKSVYVDRVRAHKSKQLIVMPIEMIEAIYKDTPDRTSASENVAAQWDAELLKKKLIKRDWEILSGKYIMGYSDKELASRINYSQESIRMALTRARRNARKILEAERSGEDE